MTSTMPEPQIPVTPVSAIASANAGLVRPGSTPMTRNRGSSVARSIRTRSIAPGAARWPPLIWAPSKAGPVGLEAASRRRGRRGRSRRSCRRRRRASSARPGAAASARITPGGVRADVAGDARQDVDAGARMRAAGPAPRPVVVTARSVASANGAQPSGIGSMPSRRWCMIGLPTIASSRISSRLMPARIASEAIEPVERLADGRGHLAGALGMHHRVRDAAHQVLAEADLRVHHAVAGEDGAVGQVGEVAGDRRRADVDRDAVGRLVEARPDADDLVRRRGPRPSRRTCPSRAPAGAPGRPRGRPRGRSGPTRARAPRTAGRDRRSATRARAA